MNIEELIMNGASEEEIAEAIALARIAKREKDKKEEEEKRRQEIIKELAEETVAKKEALKAEGRAYLINAIICYSTAFDLLSDGYEMDQEELEAVEDLLISFEEVAPLYIKMLGIDKKIKDIMDGNADLDDLI